MTRLLDSGTKLVTYSPDILAAAQKASFEIYEENAAKNPTFKEIYQQWNEFRSSVSQWNKINQLSFANFVAQ